jgi:F-type H+-transporting ATPase subunit gamma
MRRPNLIQKETEQIETIEDLTGVFQSLATTQIAKVRDRVEVSKEFFSLLWSKYSAIRVDPSTRITNREDSSSQKDAFVVISAEAGLSGDIDLRLIEAVLHDYDPKTTDIIVIGTHGAQQLEQRGVTYTHFFKVPQSDTYIDVSPIIKSIEPYKQVKVYYEEYVSIGVQNVKTIDLIQSIKAMSEDAEDNEDVISEKETIFEPSLEEIAEIMETAMKSFAFSQVILESGLAQDASRFNAMATAKKRASELVALYQLEYNRAKRSENDRQMREVMVSLKRKKSSANHA